MDKINLRPDLGLSNSRSSSQIEEFQNAVLRPVLKLQNDLVVKFFLASAEAQDANFLILTADKKSDYIRRSLQRDLRLKNILLGMVLGMLTKEEFNFYITHSKELNKRIISMVTARIKSQV